MLTMAESSKKVKVIGYVNAALNIKEHAYPDVKLTLLEDLCADVIIRKDSLSHHESLRIDFGGDRHALSICGLTALSVTPPRLSENLTPDCKPYAAKSRRYSKHDQKFNESEVQRLLQEDIIEPSNSLWRARVLVTSNECHKKRMVADYSQTVNLYEQLDAYPLPRIDDQISEIAQNKVFSTIDLKDAYHQFKLHNEDKVYTAFEAAGRL